MTNDQAKEILVLYRPGTSDLQDPEVAEAIALSRRDPELAVWLEEQTALYRAIQSKFKQIEVPIRVRQKILAEKPLIIRQWRGPTVLAAVAAIILLLGLSLRWLASPETSSFSTYRQRMVRTAMQRYVMELRTNDLEQIREFLARNNGIADYVLPKALEQMPGDGCAAVRWHNRKVSLICFDLGNQEDLYLFVINRADLSDPPFSDSPQLAKIGRLVTASWSTGEKTYLLAGPGDETFIRKFL
jgi:hypothetical protein